MIPKRKASFVPGLSVNVSSLKTHLGQYLKKVKEGAEVVVLDRQMPVAKLIAFNGEADALSQIAPTLSMKAVLLQMSESDKKRKATRLKRGSSFYLDEDRGSK